MIDERLSLTERIRAEIRSYDGLMGIYINDLKGTEICMHEHEQFETASTIKVFILACLFDEVEKGNKSLDDTLVYEERFAIDGSGVISSLAVGTGLSVRNVATLMIIVSDNIATNMMIDYLGLETINACIQKLGCRDTVLHNVIDFAKYPKLGTTTPADYGSIFTRIAERTLISPAASQQMWEILRQQHYQSMLIKSLPQYYVDPDNYSEELITIASKSGSMDACRNDGGIFTTPYGSYVIVLLNKNFGDVQYHPDHPAIVYGSRVSRLIFDQYLALGGRLTL